MMDPARKKNAHADIRIASNQTYFAQNIQTQVFSNALPHATTGETPREQENHG